MTNRIPLALPLAIALAGCIPSVDRPIRPAPAEPGSSPTPHRGGAARQVGGEMLAVAIQGKYAAQAAAVGFGKTAAQRLALAHALRVAQHGDGEIGDAVGSTVSGTVVDHDYMREVLQRALDHLADAQFLVQRRNDHGDVVGAERALVIHGGCRSPATDPCLSASILFPDPLPRLPAAAAPGALRCRRTAAAAGPAPRPAVVVRCRAA